jgi:3-oxoadipate enol-lactonase / 4-carboxymuconolactone decarboxylase
MKHFDAEELGVNRYAAGMRVRREVLGDAHVDGATSATTDFTRDFQHLITEYAGAPSGPDRAWTGAVAP